MSEFKTNIIQDVSDTALFDEALLKKKAVNGVIILSARRVIAQTIQTVAHVILARILFPHVFGEFAIILFYLNLFTLISDIGLQAAILQNDKKPTLQDLRSIFTAHMILGIFVIIVMWFGAPVFLHFYVQSLDDNSLFYLRVISFSHILYNLKLIPASLLERKIDYKRLVVGEIFELAVLELFTVWFAFLGWGVASFVWGILISRMFSAIVFFLLYPWKIGINFSYKELKQYLPFGFSYQLNTMIGAAYGALAPVVVGGLAGATALGLVGWASGLGAFPRAIGEIVGRVIFPVLARVQHDKKLLGTMIEKSIQLTNIISFPIIALMIALAEPMTYIVFTDKWKDGIPSLYLFILQSVFLVLGSVLTNALFALGFAKQVRNINLIWVSLQWLLTIPLVKAFGFTGFAMAGLIVSSTFFIALWELKKHVSITIGEYTIPYFLYASMSGIGTYVFSIIFPVKSLLDFFLTGLFGFIIYGFLLFIFSRNKISGDVMSLYRIIMN